jgi:hypothetical protein
MYEIIETPEQSDNEEEVSNEVSTSTEISNEHQFYPPGYILTFTSLYSPEEDSTVVSMGSNIFIDVSTNQVYNSYDEWIGTLPSYAEADIGISEAVMVQYAVESL